MLSFIKFARIASLAFGRSDRRRSKLCAYRSVELFEVRTVPTGIFPMGPFPMAAAVNQPTGASTGVINTVFVAGGTNTTLVSTGESMTLTPTNGWGVTTYANTIDTPTIVSITAAINNAGQTVFTINVSGLSSNATITFDGFATSISGSAVSNGTNTLTIIGGGSGSSTAQLKNSLGAQIGRAHV